MREWGGVHGKSCVLERYKLCYRVVRYNWNWRGDVPARSSVFQGLRISFFVSMQLLSKMMMMRWCRR